MRDIDAGRFVDLLELDAASNTGIDNMREILDNARYVPTVGRFKVYLIDEVHMLSKAAFNSMLKTLEEPPEHVKFVLATTDPQKIPVTVLSRCLQFNLKQLPPALIADRMTAILTAESVAFDAPALALIARAAHGSMRDALSLLDQAIAYGGGDVREGVVRTMLGAVDTEYVYRIVDALVAGDGPALLAEVDAMAIAQHRVRVGAGGPRVAVPSHRGRAGGAAGRGDDGRCRPRRRTGRAARAGNGAARLPDLRAGTRRSPARAGRGDRILDDPPAAARVRARGRVGQGGRRAKDAAPRTRAGARSRGARRCRNGRRRFRKPRGRARARCDRGRDAAGRARRIGRRCPPADADGSGRVARLRGRAAPCAHGRAARRPDGAQVASTATC